MAPKHKNNDGAIFDIPKRNHKGFSEVKGENSQLSKERKKIMLNLQRSMIRMNLLHEIVRK
jgi:hypothetical protein